MRRTIIILAAFGLVIWLSGKEPFVKVVDNTKKNWQKKTKKESQYLFSSAISTVNEYVRQKSQNVLGTEISLPIEPKPEVTVVKDVQTKQQKNIVLVDFLTAKDLTLEFALGQTYYLDLRNVPADYCLYINQTSYTVAKNEYLSLSFASAGKYRLSFDKCNRQLPVFGEIVVK